MNVVERKYNARCTVETYSEVKDSDTKITSLVKTILYDNEPCRLVVESAPAISDNGKKPSVSFTVTLLISSDLNIPPGSYVTVTQGTREYVLKASGIPQIYDTHQEITLTSEKEWA